ncbi:MAG TPA: hypothetical protein P5567_07775 [Kiritimatiellia bacterium]|nr:hypothetical protein [Kiritimatiellia bacterium]HRZ12337.1 hypothetical protein [Kiritimatiellia bacterium]HSA17905.1 hypothetical protein [Kiritimatiellia bacterium]
MSPAFASLGLMAFGSAFVVAYLLTPLAERLAPRLGLMDVPGARHAHGRPTPRAGGLAVFLGFHAGCALLYFLSAPGLEGDLTRGWWLRFLAVSSVLLAVGLADDAWRLRPLLKLAGQTVAALLAYALGIRFHVPVPVPAPELVDLALTLAWFLAIINAFNLIDGIDGLATGLALIASLGLMVSLVLRWRPGDVGVVLALAGTCLAFLRYNFHPARIFLGDGGSQFLGLALAAVSLSTASKSAVISSLLVPLLAVGVPLFDTLLAIWRRGVRHRGRVGAILEGDADHLHHRLARAGLSQRQVAMLLYLISGALILVGLLLMTLRSYVIGISLTAFVGGVYVVVRHLARVELWDTGAAILRGLRRPPRQAVCVLLYPLMDVLIMAGALAINIRLFAETPAGAFAGRLLKYSVIWVAVPFLILIVAGTYRRVWSRAGAAEYATLAAALGGGLLLAAGLANVLLGFAAREVLEYLPVYGGMTLLILIGLRGFRPVVMDCLAFRSPRRAGDQPLRRLLLYGAEDRAMLFLREHRYAALENPPREQIVGLLDDDSNLHGRLIHGYRVLGGLDFFQKQAASLGVDELVLVKDLDPETTARLLETAGRHGIAVSEWRTERRRLDGGGGQG